jgi:putative ABC transport system permease protein
MLTGIFDPPPDALAIPWGYLAFLAAAAIGSTILAIVGVRGYARRQILEALRGL